ncbi:MAG: YlmC/YmxH family sporulation protein [Anaerovoracaceae bacterium]|jgi:YlmC/YmxH family sporulation protein
MRLSELGDREIIDITTGCRFGDLAEADLLFDERNGKIKSILIPYGRSRMGFLSGHDIQEIPWAHIRKIGEDLIIVETT